MLSVELSAALCKLSDISLVISLKAAGSFVCNLESVLKSDAAVEKFVCRLVFVLSVLESSIDGSEDVVLVEDVVDKSGSDEVSSVLVGSRTPSVEMRYCLLPMPLMDMFEASWFAVRGVPPLPDASSFRANQAEQAARQAGDRNMAPGVVF